jgi:WD40 repeat protein
MSLSNPTVNDTTPLPAGIVLRHTFKGHREEIYRLQWSPNGMQLASSSADGSVRIWNAQTGDLAHHLEGHADRVYSIGWFPDGRYITSTARDKTIRTWDITASIHSVINVEDKTVYAVAWSPNGDTLASASHANVIWLANPKSEEIRQKLEGHQAAVYSLTWSPDGKQLASGSADKTIRIWDSVDGRSHHILEGHTGTVCSVVWSPDGKQLASGSADKTIRIWDSETGQQKVMIEGHTEYITSVAFSADGKLLASKSGDETVRLWRCDTWEMIAALNEPRSPSGPYLTSLSFHPKLPLLATLGDHDTVVRLWQLDTETLLMNKTKKRAVHYTNAKVVLVGDTGVGKSGLSLVLTGKPYRETESTHNRQVFVFETEHVKLNEGVDEIRETLLWDLAGQPGYRLIHQLHLSDIAVALVIFDSRNEIDPFSGVLHWVKALHQAHRAGHQLKTFLVTARVDRGHVGVSRKRIEALMHHLDIDQYFETSAKEGWQIPELITAIHNAIDWSKLPKVSSTDLFKQIKDFLGQEKTTGLRLVEHEALYLSFLRNHKLQHSDELRMQFDTCLNLVASRGLIQSFSFGDLLLLQPELLDAYASAIVNAAKNEPEGLGYLREEDVLRGNFTMSSSERIKSKGQERLLLIATVEKLLNYEIALRVQVNDDSYLVFPSQLTREQGDIMNPEGKSVKFTFEGAVLNIYATLVVRLAQNGLFRLKDMWKNAATYSPIAKEATCGILLNEGESEAELTLFFDKNTSNYVRYQFEEYIHTHLKRRSLPGQVKRTYFTVCHECSYIVPEQVIELRKQRHFNWVNCPVCSHRITFAQPTDETIPTQPHWIKQMEAVANQRRDLAVALSTLDGKIAVGSYDVFLCHNNKDKPLVKKIGTKLKERGLLPWLDEWELRPGIAWQKILEQQIQKVKATAVFVGENGIGPWQDMEQAAFIREFVKRECPVIPIVLPTCKQPPQLPVFLASMTWVDFRKNVPDPFQQLIWGITGEREVN